MVMVRAKQWLVIALLLFSPPIGMAGAAGVQLSTAETEAQQHCPADTVVWVNTPTGIYHFKGMRWYGATIRGAYVCQKEGDQAGYRATRNGH